MNGGGKRFHRRYRKKTHIYCRECANFNVLTKKTIKA